ncbi:MAG: methyltransferase domain-containing protein [Nitrospinae bacterium]|nr:methyltransferase domain-containing protein [Nitrospinota bacterium]
MGFMRKDGMMDKQGRVNEYFGGVSGEYNEKSARGLWRLVREAEYAAVMREIGPVEGLCVFEAGCGGGWYSRRLAQLKPRLLVASDALFPMTRAARTGTTKGVVADISNLPVKPVFDRILCAGAMEFVADPSLFVMEAARVLKPGGRLVILSPSTTFLARIYRFWHKRHGFEINLFSEEAFRQMAERSGLRVESIKHAPLFNLAVRMVKP